MTSVDSVFNLADKVGYPDTCQRPSYGLSGAAMNVAYNAGEPRRTFATS